MSVETTEDLNGDEDNSAQETEDGDLVTLATDATDEEKESEDSDDDQEAPEDDTKALDELEAEELEMLTEDESTENRFFKQVPF